MAYGAGLENRLGSRPRGFESLHFRHMLDMSSNKRLWIIISVSVLFSLIVISFIFYNQFFREEVVEEETRQEISTELIEGETPEIPEPPVPQLGIPTPQ